MILDSRTGANRDRRDAGRVTAVLATAIAGRDDLPCESEAARQRQDAAGVRRVGRPDPPVSGSHSAANDRDSYHSGYNYRDNHHSGYVVIPKLTGNQCRILTVPNPNPRVATHR